MYRHGLGSVTTPQSIQDSIINLVLQKAQIKSDKITTQTLLISLNTRIGFAYLQRDDRTILSKATKISVYEDINQLTGEVTYHQTTEFSERYGKPPVYVTTLENEILAVQYEDLKKHSLYETYQRREIWFTIEDGREYRLTTRENTLSIEMYSKTLNNDFSLPQWLYDIMYQEDGKYIKNYAETKAAWREKQEAAIAERKAAVQERKAEQAKKKKEQQKAKQAAKKTKKKTVTKTTKTTKTKTQKPKQVKEKTLTEQWADFGQRHQ